MAEEDVFKRMAQRYSQEPDIEYTEEVVNDSVAEFLNVTNGLYLINLSIVIIRSTLLPTGWPIILFQPPITSTDNSDQCRFGSFQLILLPMELLLMVKRLKRAGGFRFWDFYAI